MNGLAIFKLEGKFVAKMYEKEIYDFTHLVVFKNIYHFFIILLFSAFLSFALSLSVIFFSFFFLLFIPIFYFVRKYKRKYLCIFFPLYVIVFTLCMPSLLDLDLLLMRYHFATVSGFHDFKYFWQHSGLVFFYFIIVSFAWNITYSIVANHSPLLFKIQEINTQRSNFFTVYILKVNLNTFFVP